MADCTHTHNKVLRLLEEMQPGLTGLKGLFSLGCPSELTRPGVSETHPPHPSDAGPPALAPAGLVSAEPLLVPAGPAPVGSHAKSSACSTPGSAAVASSLPGSAAIASSSPGSSAIASSAAFSRHH